MIIACPECTSPFEVADGHIAPLVQVECPSCNFRMILDFEAANDVSLREEGMALAQGFRDAASYRLAVGAGHVVYSGAGAATSGAERPSLRAVPDDRGAEPTPVAQPVAPEPAPVRQPPVEPPIEKPPIRQPVVQPTVEEPLVAEQPQLELAEPELDKPPVRHPPERRARATLIAHTPPPPRPVVAPPEPVVQPTTQVEAQVETHGDNLDLDVDVDEPEVAQPEIRQPEIRRPEPAEPPRPEPTVTTTKPSTSDESRPEEADEGKVKDTGKRSPARTVVTLLLLLILLAVGGAMVWSLITTGHPYQKLLELSGLAAPQDAKSNDKGDGKADNKADAKSDEQADG
ncbi:MAG TPA: hypothetical protein VM869_33990 [Enhygromyxa sp.]|nr:hypothetical protein [Enhygromyxa sp.]